MINEKFRKRCLKVAEKLDLAVDFNDDPRADDTFEDDGTLHVLRGGLRACFDVSNGQTCEADMQNAWTRAVLTALSMKRAITDRVLVDEGCGGGDESGEYCPHCGEKL